MWNKTILLHKLVNFVYFPSFLFKLITALLSPLFIYNNFRISVSRFTLKFCSMNFNYCEDSITVLSLSTDKFSTSVHVFIYSSKSLVMFYHFSPSHSSFFFLSILYELFLLKNEFYLMFSVGGFWYTLNNFA